MSSSGLYSALNKGTLSFSTIPKIIEVLEVPYLDLRDIEGVYISPQNKSDIVKLNQELDSLKAENENLIEQLSIIKEENYSLLKELNEAKQKIIELFDRAGFYEKGINISSYQRDFNDIDKFIKELKESKKQEKDFEKFIMNIKKKFNINE